MFRSTLTVLGIQLFALIPTIALFVLLIEPKQRVVEDVLLAHQQAPTV
jgi:hypothetical protein